ncbi:unnamed protein product [Adineta steineri]|uniref:Large ribosomal subunit protein uL23 N-terminal domain-containing protein n=1 Tax=Adineta steineri TaxID=433720 RepID=A0A816DFA5_9BILA|nr:unnamed protein product [Adineta steineri]CAF1408599.1 unnamed protein product [Adineta steineri]CAF1415751.1 unnamed protein product [Adineta steineri]CAF1464365.1 unnamed protein product [Adineta steineri]CAF1634065.1 unnamed protein product [Adineta steineri]
MAPKKDSKEAAASTKKKDTPAAAATATATASAKKPTKPAGSTTTTATKVVTKDRKEKVQTKALKAKQRVVRGNQLTRNRKVYSKPTFRRPHTLRLQRSPKYPRRSVPKRNRLDHFAIIKHPLTTESAMKKIEDNNTLVFIVSIRANKPMIKAAVKKMYDVDAEKINTLIRPDGEKKAYVRLKADHDALDVANRIGII